MQIMKEYEYTLEYFPKFDSGITGFLKSDHKDDIEKAEKFLNKYWLDKSEYDSVWKPVQDYIFHAKQRRKGTIFKDDFTLIVAKGGQLFWPERFEKFKAFISAMGEENFVVVHNVNELNTPLFRLKFPVDITWDEMMSGDYVSAFLCGFPCEEYMLYGKSRKWGRYAGNDFAFPLDMYAFEQEYANVFDEIFKISKQERRELYENDRFHLPQAYKDLIKKQGDIL